MSSRDTLPDLVARALHEQAAAVVVSPAVAAERSFRARRRRRLHLRQVARIVTAVAAALALIVGGGLVLAEHDRTSQPAPPAAPEVPVTPRDLPPLCRRWVRTHDRERHGRPRRAVVRDGQPAGHDRCSWS